MTEIRATGADPKTDPPDLQGNLGDPSPWVNRFAPLVPAGGAVLDLACGKGRHTLLFRGRGHPVTAVDRDVSLLGDAAREGPRDDSGVGARVGPRVGNVTVIEADVEGGPWPLGGQTFSGIVVTNYLHRPLMPRLIAALAPGGVLIYETFAKGNEAFGRPRSPDHLLAPGELLDVFGERLSVAAYEHGYVETPRPRVIQHICAINMPKDDPPPLSPASNT